MRDGETVQERKQAGHAPTNVSLGAAADTMTRTRAYAHALTHTRERAFVYSRYVIQLEQLTNNGRTAHH